MAMEYKIRKDENRNCLECGNEIPYYREGKQFCDDTCRYSYHNKHRNKARGYRTRILNIILKNHEILSGYLEEGINEIDIAELEASGFIPYYCTWHSKANRKNEYRCFEFKYCLSDTRVYNLEKTLR